MVSVRHELTDKVLYISVKGRIDSNSAGTFREELSGVLEACDFEKILFDFARLDYVSSAGLRVFLNLRKSLDKSVQIEAENLQEAVKEVFELTGFDDIILIAESGTVKAQTRAVFFDVDGTLLSHKTGKVPESTIEALEALRKKGILTIICTGRDIRELAKLPVIDIPFDGYLTLNGNLCLDENKKMFAGNPIDPEEVEILVRIFRSEKIPFVVIGEENRYINYVDDLVIDTQTATKGTIPDIGQYHGEKIYQCIAFVTDKERLMLEKLLDDCIITSWNKTGIDIISKHGGKAAGIQKFMDHYLISQSETMAFGDGENDIPMIRFAGIGIAMGNAIDSVKNKADYVTTDIDDDGIANALRHYGLID